MGLVACGGPPPELVAIRLEGPTSALERGSLITVNVEGRNADDEVVHVAAWLTPELSGQPRLLAESEVQLTANNERSLGSWSFRLGEEAFAYEGTHLLSFTADYDGVLLRSTELSVEVRPRLVGLVVTYKDALGTRSLSGGETVPSEGQVELTLRTVDLARRRVVEVETVLDGTRVMERAELDPLTDEVKLSRTIDPRWISASGSARIQYRARMGEETVESPEFVVATFGIYSCGFREPEGAEVSPGTRVPPGRQLLMQARVWGKVGQSALLELWEQDTSDDDFVARFEPVEANGYLTIPLTTQWIDDGLLDTEDEYYLVFDFGGARCRSGLLVVTQ